MASRKHLRWCPSLLSLDGVRGLGWVGWRLPFIFTPPRSFQMQVKPETSLLRLPTSCLSSLAPHCPLSGSWSPLQRGGACLAPPTCQVLCQVPTGFIATYPCNHWESPPFCR